MIPFVDLHLQYLSIKNEIDPKIQSVLDSHDFIQGSFVTEFENIFCQLHHCQHTIGCSNGTTAIFTILSALGIKTGDEVITTPHTFIATTEAICHTGAKPVFVDIDPATYNIDPTKLEKAISSKTKAILPVHLYGNPADIFPIQEIAKKHNILIIEDCAQAHLATYNGQMVGNFGVAAAFSFYPGKNLGAYGDAGAIVTNDSELAAKCRSLIDHGRQDKYTHQIIGYNHRMDSIQAAVLSIKSQHIVKWTDLRRQHASKYSQLLKSHPQVKLPICQENSSPVYHLYVIQVPHRDRLLTHLKEKEVSCGIHYPTPLHLQPALKYLNYHPDDFPITESVSQNIISLPMFPELTDSQIEFVCQNVIDFLSQNV